MRRMHLVAISTALFMLLALASRVAPLQSYFMEMAALLE